MVSKRKKFSSFFRLVLTLSIGTLWACKSAGTYSSGDSSEINAAASASPGTVPGNQKTYIMVSFGGYWSCGQNPQDLSDWSPLRIESAVDPILPFVRKIRELVKEENNIKIREFVGCFSIDPRYIYVASTLKGKVDVEKLPVEQVYGRFHELVRPIPNPQISVLGFSYGGPIAMEFVSRLPTTYRVTRLTTMDPISHKECTPDELVKSINSKKYDGPCQRFPADFSREKIDAIADKVGGNWSNYYQRQALYIRSNQVQDSRGRIKNVFKDYKDQEISLMGHARFIIDRDLAFEIARDLAASFRN